MDQPRLAGSRPQTRTDRLQRRLPHRLTALRTHKNGAAQRLACSLALGDEYWQRLRKYRGFLLRQALANGEALLMKRRLTCNCPIKRCGFYSVISPLLWSY